MHLCVGFEFWTNFYPKTWRLTYMQVYMVIADFVLMKFDCI